MKKLNDIYRELYDYYGPQYWWPANTELEMIVGAILVQNTNWNNVEKALINLSPYLSYDVLLNIEVSQLQELIRPAGFFVRKAQTIKNFINWFYKYKYNVKVISHISTEQLRKELIEIKGIGPETADCILLYAFNRTVFVVDSYLIRLLATFEMNNYNKYNEYQMVVMEHIEPDLFIYQEFHALIVQYGKDFLVKQPDKSSDPLHKLRKK